MKAQFTLEKKLVAQVRYYSHLYVIKDGVGDRIYTGSDEKTAKLILKTLQAYNLRQRVRVVKRLKEIEKNYGYQGRKPRANSKRRIAKRGKKKY